MTILRRSSSHGHPIVDRIADWQPWPAACKFRAELYDSATAAWTATGSMSIARAYYAAVLLRNGKVLVAGGADGLWPHDTAETYHPQSRNWTPTGRLHKAYEAHLALLLNDGKVLVAGRPDSGDRTGNEGRPTPTPTVATPRPPDPLDWLLTPLPTATRKASQDMDAARNDNAAEVAPAARDDTELAALAVQASSSLSNYTTGDPAKLYGVHEVSFTLAAESNPYAITRTVLFTPQVATSQFVTVMAFYDGPATLPDRDLWRARVYVNRVGTWTWTPPAGAQNAAGQALTSGSFSASEDKTSGLRGMLRVSSSVASVGTSAQYPVAGAPKRWYTDDGRTFLPLADSAYRLFFQRPGLPSNRNCPQRSSEQAGQDFVRDYAGDASAQGINVLRVEALGNWAYSAPNPDDCEADLSLFWNHQKWWNPQNGAMANLFNGAPNECDLGAAPTSFYPNHESFTRVDELLQLLLNNYPGLYLQMLLLPEPQNTLADSGWRPCPEIKDSAGNLIQPVSSGIPDELRKQMWRAMVARWAAFPNVFWAISNDLGDTATTGNIFNDRAYPNNVTLAQEIGCYVADCSGIPGNDPWRAKRPLSLGHLRYRDDSSATQTWHTFITAYAGGDIAAQMMDGRRPLPTSPPWLQPYQYSQKTKPTFNVEDFYEGAGIVDPSYYFRRLFWSYLLSGSGATYGAFATYEGRERYSTANLAGLAGVKQIPTILAAAHIDLNLFQPNDALITDWSTFGEWADFNRPQVAARGAREILIYLPNTDPASVPYSLTQSITPEQIKGARAATTAVTVSISMTAFTDFTYAVTWYNPQTGIAMTATAIPGASPAMILQAPAGLTGDAILHISSLCRTPNACLPMDEEPAVGVAGFEIQTSSPATIHQDPDYNIAGNAWRCDNGKCRIEYSFPMSKTIASAGFYFRRDTPSTAASESGITGIRLWPALAPAEAGWIITHLYPDGLLIAEQAWMYNSMMQTVFQAAPDLHRWYHLETRVERVSSNRYRLRVFLDGVVVADYQGFGFHGGDRAFNGITVYAETPAGYSVWLDELSIDPETTEDARGLLRAFVQQGLDGYTGTTATFLDVLGGYNNTATLSVGQNGLAKSLLRFNLVMLPTDAIVDEAILQLYYTGRSNGNSLTLGAHGVLTDWTDSQVNWTQRKTGVNWNAVGMGSGSDYAAAAAATVAVSGAGGSWVDLNITSLAQTWVNNSATNLGLALTQEASSGYVNYNFCSELGWTPCTAAQAPKLTLRYHLFPPPPVKATFQRGVNGYTDHQATWFDAAGSSNNTAELLVGQNGIAKSLLKFAVATLPITATVDEATLRLYQTGRSNGNLLTLGAHRVLADWVDSQANWTQRQSGVNWGVAGMGSGSDYTATADGTASLTSAGGAWVDLDVKTMVQAWVANPTQNLGLVLTQDAASGYVYYTFCSELGWSPCSATQAPQLTVWYH